MPAKGAGPRDGDRHDGEDHGAGRERYGGGRRRVGEDAGERRVDRRLDGERHAGDEREGGEKNRREGQGELRHGHGRPPRPPRAG
jgi:hypothetical protein